MRRRDPMNNRRHLRIVPRYYPHDAPCAFISQGMADAAMDSLKTVALGHGSLLPHDLPRVAFSYFASALPGIMHNVSALMITGILNRL